MALFEYKLTWCRVWDKSLLVMMYVFRLTKRLPVPIITNEKNAHGSFFSFR